MKMRNLKVIIQFGVTIEIKEFYAVTWPDSEVIRQTMENVFQAIDIPGSAAVTDMDTNFTIYYEITI